MKNAFLPSRALRVGLDLGAHSLKAAVVDAAGRVVQRLWAGETHPERSGRRCDPSEGTLQDCLRHLVSAGQSETSSNWDVTGAVQGRGTVCSYAEFPPMPPSELAVAVPFRVRKDHPFQSNELSVFEPGVHCHDLGYRGPVAIDELLERTQRMRRLPVRKVPLTHLAHVAREEGASHPAPERPGSVARRHHNP